MQIINNVCDRCFNDDTQVPSDGTTLIEINARGIEVDLCTKHSEELTELLAPYYEVGRRPDRVSVPKAPKSQRVHKATKNDGHYNCLEGDCKRFFTSLQGLAMHRYRTHNLPHLSNEHILELELEDIPGESPIDRKRRRDRAGYARRKMEREEMEREAQEAQHVGS